MKTFVLELIDNAIGSYDPEEIYELPSMVIGIINANDPHPKRSQIYEVLSRYDGGDYSEAIVTKIGPDEDDDTYFHIEVEVPVDNGDSTEWTTEYFNMYEVPIVV